MPSPGRGYARRLGLFDATMLVVGGIIGAGIFLNPAVVAQRAPTLWLTLGVWVLGGAVALAGAFVFAELAARDDLPQFDIIVLHGIWTWVTEDDRAAIVDLANRSLAPGGLLYFVIVGQTIRCAHRSLALCHANPGKDTQWSHYKLHLRSGICNTVRDRRTHQTMTSLQS